MSNLSANILLDEGKTEEDNLMPHNIDAEQEILGNLLSNNESYSKVGDIIRAEHFYEPIHQVIFAAIVEFYNKGIVATPVTLKSYFNKNKELDELGGSEYLSNLVSSSSIMLNIKSYAQVIFDLYLKRKLQTLGTDVVNEISNNEKPTDSSVLIEQTEQKLFNLASEGNLEGDFQKIDVSLNLTLETVQNALNNSGFSGIPTDLTDLDKLLGGIQNSDLLILAGRPSMGKTALAINMAVNMCKYYQNQEKEEDKKSVGFFSLEMSSEQLASRIIAMESGVNAQKFRSGNFSNDDFSAIVKANKELHKLKFFIDDTPALSISAIRTRARRLKRQNNLGVLYVDYLQLIRGTFGGENRVQEITEISQGLKAIAKELNIPVIALSQLSRAVEAREDKRPQLSDLRESGSIEQDADIVSFIFREQYYIERKRPQEGSKKHDEWQSQMDSSLNKAEIIIAKQRHGPIGSVDIRFEPSTTKFGDLETNSY
jgi:replicative DNA helicase